MSDNFYMSRAFYLASKGKFTTTPNPNVGCVIVNNGGIVGEGWHSRIGEAHAEENAIYMAGKKAKGSTAYVTLEPCSHYGHTPPCCEALIKAGIKRVVMTILDPNPKVSGRGLFQLKKAGIQVYFGLMKQRAEYLNRGFLKRMRTGLPWIQIKLGMSLDGKTKMINYKDHWITSIESRRDVQYWRAQSSAILSSSSTIISDNPLLNVRWENFSENMKKLYSYKKLRQPVRIIIDSKNRVTPKHFFVKESGKIILVRLHIDKKYIWPTNIEQLIVPVSSYKKKIDLIKLMLILGEKKINTVFVEAGFSLSGAFLKAGLVDELIIYVSPKLLGDRLNGLFKLPVIKNINDIYEFSFKNIRKIGTDLRLILTPLK